MNPVKVKKLLSAAGRVIFLICTILFIKIMYSGLARRLLLQKGKRNELPDGKNKQLKWRRK
jgi:hypothetical protein